jgi:nitrite reductase/ring-hydroxylating ferredoxin subunit
VRGVVEQAIAMQVEVAKLSEIPVGTMKRVRALDQDILLSNVAGKIYATQNACGHMRASLARGTLEGNIITCAMHGSKFDATTGKVVSGIRPGMPPIVAEIDVQPLKTYEVEVKGDSVYVQDGV